MHMLGYRPETSFDPMAGYGVTIFFVLSAFLLTVGAAADWDALRQHEHATSESAKLWGRYFVRRFFRIYPTYLYVVLLATYVVPLAYCNELRPDMLFGNLTLSAAHWILWAIPMECEYYLIIPILVVLHQRARHAKHSVAARAALYAAIVAVGALSAHLYGDKYLPSGSMLWIHLPRRLWEFLTGSLAAFVYTDLRDRGFLPTSAHEKGPARDARLRTLYNALAFVSLLFVFLALPHYAKRILSVREDWAWPYLSIFVGGVVLFGVLSREDGFVAKAFSSPLLRMAGQVSFSTYLLHPLGFFVATYATGGWLKEGPANERQDQILLGWIVTAALAYLSWRWVEKPGMALGGRINRSLELAPRDAP
jgi:peptidoglycan/LPS O-acetylase OafA/YrhL